MLVGYQNTTTGQIIAVDDAHPLPVTGVVSSTGTGATTDAAVQGDNAGSVSAKLRGLNKYFASLFVSAINALQVFSVPNPQTPASYRSAIAAADVMALPGTVTCTKIAGAGLTAGAYVTKIVAGNAHGRTTAVTGSATITTETTNLRINAAFAAVAGATFYDVYCTTAADPLWCGRITEAQRASGIVIDSVGHTAAGGSANSVDIGAIGTGAAASTAAQNTSWVIPASPVDCTGYSFVDFDLTCSRTGDAVAPALTVTPFFLNSRTSTYSQGQAVALVFGGATGVFGSMCQRIRVECRGNSGLALLVTAIAGTGMAVSIDATRS